MRFPAWKYALIFVVMLVSSIYALPNFYPDEPALQVSGAQASVPVDADLLKRAAFALDEAKIAHHGDEVQAKGVLLRLNTPEAQVQAQAVLRRALGENYVVALNLAPTTPHWLSSIGGKPMKLGLDLRGGVHFQLEVDVDKALEQRQEGYISDIKKALRDKQLAYRAVAELPGGALDVRFASEADRDAGATLIRRDFADFQVTPVAGAEGPALKLDFTPAKRREITDYAIGQNLTTLRNRINELGVAEALVQRQGSSRIVVELPGLQDTAEAKRILGRTASLEFRFTSTESAEGFSAPPGTERFERDVAKAPDPHLPAGLLGGDAAAQQHAPVVEGDAVFLHGVAGDDLGHARELALHVDEVLGNQEVVVKNLGPQLARLPGLAGMSVLASGAVVLIYNPVALSAVYGDQARRLSADRKRRVLIEGHTDERGGREYNLALGQKRAEAVAKSLALLGAADSQVEAVSFGEERPADPGHDGQRPPMRCRCRSSTAMSSIVAPTEAHAYRNSAWRSRASCNGSGCWSPARATRSAWP